MTDTDTANLRVTAMEYAMMLTNPAIGHSKAISDTIQAADKIFAYLETGTVPADPEKTK